jgi:hypothetical protein
MRLDLIEKVEFGVLNENPDRKGTIAIFHCKGSSNIQYVEMSQTETAKAVRSIIEMLNVHYTWNEDSLFGECQSCWVGQCYNRETTVCVTHKYWSEKEIELFKIIVTAIGDRHRWDIVDHNLVKETIK